MCPRGCCRVWCLHVEAGKDSVWRWVHRAQGSSPCQPWDSQRGREGRVCEQNTKNSHLGFLLCLEGLLQLRVQGLGEPFCSSASPITLKFPWVDAWVGVCFICRWEQHCSLCSSPQHTGALPGEVWGAQPHRWDPAPAISTKRLFLHFGTPLVHSLTCLHIPASAHCTVCLNKGQY